MAVKPYDDLMNQPTFTPLALITGGNRGLGLQTGGEGADLDVSEGGKTSAWLAMLPTDGPTGGYFHLGEPLPW